MVLVRVRDDDTGEAGIGREQVVTGGQEIAVVRSRACAIARVIVARAAVNEDELPHWDHPEVVVALEDHRVAAASIDEMQNRGRHGGWVASQSVATVLLRRESTGARNGERRSVLTGMTGIGGFCTVESRLRERIQEEEEREI